MGIEMQTQSDPEGMVVWYFVEMLDEDRWITVDVSDLANGRLRFDSYEEAAKVMEKLREQAAHCGSTAKFRVSDYYVLACGV